MLKIESSYKHSFPKNHDSCFHLSSTNLSDPTRDVPAYDAMGNEPFHVFYVNDGITYVG